MPKHIKIVDMETGQIELDSEVRGGYSLQYSKGEDSGHLHIHGRIENGRYGKNHWIKNWAYYDTLVKILKLHSEQLEKINPNRILFLEDINYEPESSEKIDWAFRIKKAPKDMTETWGYLYIIESRNYWVERLSDENIVARIFRCLKRIDGMGGLKDYDIMDFSETHSEFGTGWLVNPHRQVADILDKDFQWSIVRKSKSQISIVDYMNDKEKEAI